MHVLQPLFTWFHTLRVFHGGLTKCCRFDASWNTRPFPPKCLSYAIFLVDSFSICSLILMADMLTVGCVKLLVRRLLPCQWWVLYFSSNRCQWWISEHSENGSFLDDSASLSVLPSLTGAPATVMSSSYSSFSASRYFSILDLQLFCYFSFSSSTSSINSGWDSLVVVTVSNVNILLPMWHASTR